MTHEFDFSSLFWIFLVFVMVYPAIQRRLVDAGRVKMIRTLEKKRQSRVIALIHRQEVMSFLGFPLVRFISIEDSEEILRAIRLTPDEMPIDLILHTPGGLVVATNQIATALKRHPAKVTIFVPHYAMSGGTLIAMAADEIVMDENAILGPVDPQIGQFPAASILNAVNSKDPSDVDDNTLILADQARKAIRQMKCLVKELLLKHLPEDRAEASSQSLSDGRYTHDYPITVDKAQALGLPVSATMPTEVYQLMNLFPQKRIQRPSVEYLPIPYPSRKPKTGAGVGLSIRFNDPGGGP